MLIASLTGVRAGRADIHAESDHAYDDVNTTVLAGRADLCALARPHLADPYWALHAAAQLGYAIPWPQQYLTGREQYLRNLARAAQAVAS